MFIRHYTSIPRRVLREGSRQRFLAFTVILLIAGAAALAYVRQIRLIRSMSDDLPAPPLVCIDPGHPTRYNSGRQIINGTSEMEINWQVALKLEDILANEHGLRVIKTREERDRMMSNPDRARIANEAGASLMVRLHCDAGLNKGFTVYYPNQQGESLGVTGPSREIIDASRSAAHLLHSGMAAKLRGILNDRGVMGETRTKVGRMQGALTGSVFSKVPVVTVEMVFLTNYDDAEFIKSEWGQDLMAKALADGVMAYLESAARQ